MTVHTAAPQVGRTERPISDAASIPSSSRDDSSRLAAERAQRRGCGGPAIHTPGHRVQRSAQFGPSRGLSDRPYGESKSRRPARESQFRLLACPGLRKLHKQRLPNQTAPRRNQIAELQFVDTAIESEAIRQCLDGRVAQDAVLITMTTERLGSSRTSARMQRLIAATTVIWQRWWRSRGSVPSSSTA